MGLSQETSKRTRTEMNITKVYIFCSFLSLNRIRKVFQFLEKFMEKSIYMLLQVMLVQILLDFIVPRKINGVDFSVILRFDSTKRQRKENL